MPRPQKDRLVGHPPLFSDFKPVGVRRRSLETITLSLDEYEAIRLTDLLKLEHSQAAEKMEISRPTFTRLIEQARSKIAQFLIEGKHLSIEGGNIHFRRNIYKCESCGYIFKSAIEKIKKNCPDCGSEEIVDLASEFGHGNCCRGRIEDTSNE